VSRPPVGGRHDHLDFELFFVELFFEPVVFLAGIGEPPLQDGNPAVRSGNVPPDCAAISRQARHMPLQRRCVQARRRT
jgi:hypothetical protein